MCFSKITKFNLGEMLLFIDFFPPFWFTVHSSKQKTVYLLPGMLSLLLCVFLIPVFYLETFFIRVYFLLCVFSLQLPLIVFISVQCEQRRH